MSFLLANGFSWYIWNSSSNRAFVSRRFAGMGMAGAEVGRDFRVRDGDDDDGPDVLISACLNGVGLPNDGGWEIGSKGLWWNELDNERRDCAMDAGDANISGYEDCERDSSERRFPAPLRVTLAAPDDRDSCMRRA